MVNPSSIFRDSRIQPESDDDELVASAKRRVERYVRHMLTEMAVPPKRQRYGVELLLDAFECNFERLREATEQVLVDAQSAGPVSRPFVELASQMLPTLTRLSAAHTARYLEQVPTREWNEQKVKVQSAE